MSAEKLNIDTLSAFLQKELSGTLPGVNAHKPIVPVFPETAIEYFNKHEKLKEAAVLIILFEEDSIIKTALIERMPDPGPHSSQIAFPGGRRDIGDNDLIDTALRETDEEIGVSIKRENIIGVLTPVEIPISGFSVLPVVCKSNDISKFTLCEDEVKNIFVVPFFQLLSSLTKKEIYTRGRNIVAPCFIFEDRVVWGATAMVLNEIKVIVDS